MRRPRLNVMVFVCALLPINGMAQTQAQSFSDWLAQGRWTVDSRYRIESVDQSSLTEDALASTLRLQAGFETGVWNGFSAVVEGELVRPVGDEQFNSTTNGQTQYPVVADPETTEINQAYVYYRRNQLHVIAGRQVLPIRNERFLGSVDFRQNQQTYDALMLMHRGAAGVIVAYGYMDGIRRFLGDDHPAGDLDMSAHMLHIEYPFDNGDTLTTYAHYLDMQTLPLTTRSHRNLGIRYEGSFDTTFAKWLYHLEFADQSSHADGASTIDADYFRAELGPRFANQWLLLVGLENMGGDGTYGFQTPFATGHAYNGRADIFATGTPPAGLRDSYLSLRAPVGGTSVELAYHQFDSDQGGIDYGDEIDFIVSHRFMERFQLIFELADYRANSFAADTTRVSLSIRFEY